MEINNIIGLKIAYFRKLNDLTQEELAKKINVSPQAISKWEQHLSFPDIMLLPKLAEIFCISIDDLFREKYKLDKEIVYSLVHNLPWKDDGKIRLTLYNGTKLMKQTECLVEEGLNKYNFQFHDFPYLLKGTCKFSFEKADYDDKYFEN